MKTWFQNFCFFELSLYGYMTGMHSFGNSLGSGLGGGGGFGGGRLGGGCTSCEFS
jgi:hypothetical protein